jgi:hypothetical protein
VLGGYYDVEVNEQLNAFHDRFEASNTKACMRSLAVPDDCVITLSVADVSKTFKQVNIHKAVGPDGLPRRLLRACVDQLASVFTDIFNLSQVYNTYIFLADHHSPCAQEREGKLPK